MNIYKIDKNKLKSKLNTNNIKQSFIAYKMDVSDRTVSRWVTGKVVFIKLYNLKKLCHILDCDPVDITVQNQDAIVDALIEKNLLEKLSPYGDFDLVEKIFLKSITEEMTDKRRAEVNLILANTNWRNKNYQTAITYIDAALKICKDREIQFEANLHLGTVYSMTGNLKALETLLNAYDLKEYSKSPDRIASLCNNISMVYREMGIIDNAIDFMEEAYEYFDIEDKYYNLCISCQGFMTIYNEINKPLKSLEYSKLAKTYAKKSHYDDGVKSILLYELDALSQLNQSITHEHQDVLDKVMNKSFIDYYALEAVFRYLIRTNSNKIDGLKSIYIEEVPPFVKAMICQLTGDYTQARNIYRQLGFNNRNKSIVHLDL